MVLKELLGFGHFLPAVIISLLPLFGSIDGLLDVEPQIHISLQKSNEVSREKHRRKKKLKEGLEGLTY